MPLKVEFVLKYDRNLLLAIFGTIRKIDKFYNIRISPWLSKEELDKLKAMKDL